MVDDFEPELAQFSISCTILVLSALALAVSFTRSLPLGLHATAGCRALLLLTFGGRLLSLIGSRLPEARLSLAEILLSLGGGGRSRGCLGPVAVGFCPFTAGRPELRLHRAGAGRLLGVLFIAQRVLLRATRLPFLISALGRLFGEFGSVSLHRVLVNANHRHGFLQVLGCPCEPHLLSKHYPVAKFSGKCEGVTSRTRNGATGEG